MKLGPGKLAYLVGALTVALPADRAATIVARLETVPPAFLAKENLDELYESDPALLGLHVYAAGAKDNGDPTVEAIRAGRELYRTEEIRTGDKEIFRAYIPFHSAGQVYVARIDLSPAAPDFVLVHARHNVEIAVASGAVLLLVPLTAIWSLRRSAQLERRKMETERLAELGSVSAVLAHEIRNPLGALKGFAQLAAEGAADEKRKLLDAIVRECGRLEALVNSLLLYGRPLAPEIRETDWPALESDLAAYVGQAIGHRPIEFRSESEIDRLATDAGLLKQALLNLISNSVESIPEG